MQTTPEKPLLLVVDDEKNVRESIDIALSQEGLSIRQAHNSQAAIRTLREQLVDIMILDIRLGDEDGLALYRKLQIDGIAVPTIFISGNASLSEAASAVQYGAFDFLEKPFNADKLLVTVRRALEHTRLIQRLTHLEASQANSDIVGDSAAIRQILSTGAKVAKSNAGVLIQGESGTGKELLANFIHQNSSRAIGPFVKVNCSAIPENLIESELFGHEKGAFTGAISVKKGLFEVAHRGSIFLDEVADLSLAAQAKILRILQSGEVQKVGSEKAIHVDVRVISATHKDLKVMSENGSFREDLFYRLNVVPIRIPSLRERREDIPLLVNFFSKQISRRNNLKEKLFEPEAIEQLKRHAWPGNIRELQNTLERIMILGGDRISVFDLPEEIRSTDDSPQLDSNAPNLKTFRDHAERQFIIDTLKRVGANITQAAQELGIGRAYLHRRMNQLNIDKKDYLI